MASLVVDPNASSLALPMTTQTLSWPLSVLLLAVAGCGFPIEPGSDLPDASPPAVLGPVAPQPDVGLPEAEVSEGSDVTGTFDITGALDNPLGEPINLAFIGVATQQGEIASGMATLNIELRNPDTPGEPGPTFDAPAPITATGSFEGAALDLLIPQSFSDLLVEDATADVSLNGQIIDSDCISGLLTLGLKDARIEGLENPISIPLNGTFQAARQGAACNF